MKFPYINSHLNYRASRFGNAILPETDRAIVNAVDTARMFRTLIVLLSARAVQRLASNSPVKRLPSDLIRLVSSLLPKISTIWIFKKILEEFIYCLNCWPCWRPSRCCWPGCCCCNPDKPSWLDCPSFWFNWSLVVNFCWMLDMFVGFDFVSERRVTYS